MSDTRQIDSEQLSFFDSVLTPELGKVRADGAQASAPSAGAGELVETMVRFPGSWVQRMGELTAPSAWGDAASAPPLPLAETLVLGYLLADNAKGISANGMPSVRAAVLWYRSALLAETDADGPTSPLGYCEPVLTPVARAVTGSPDLALRLGWGLETVFEHALASADGAGRAASLRRHHSGAMQRVAWPLLRGAAVVSSYRLVLGAWVATESEDVLRNGLIQILDTPGRSLAVELAEVTSVDAGIFLLAVIRRSSRSLSTQVRANLAGWINAVASRARDDETPAARTDLLGGLIEILSEA